MTKGKETTVEDHMEDISLNDNPYEGMVEDCVKRQSQQTFARPSPKKPWIQQMSPNEFLPANFQMPTPHDSVTPDRHPSEPDNSGVKITFNDEAEDVANADMRYNHEWVGQHFTASVTCC